ncbi:hypothetical protein ISS07_02920 [Candidatus Woesearchaeota archaeon]|nr:hypothetical protein [Candidatus Woesearchaeota archaeon]
MKRDKSRSSNLNLDDLDIPPEPPKSDNAQNFQDISMPNIEDFPDIGQSKELESPIPPLNENKQDIQIPPIDVSQSSIQEMPKISERIEPYFGEKSKPEAEMRPDAVMPSSFEPKHTLDMEERFEKRSAREEKDVLLHKDASGPIFVKIDRFRNVLKNISTIRGSLKGANDMLVKMEEIDINSDKEFEKWKNTITDIQKKMIFVDKTLFKR